MKKNKYNIVAVFLISTLLLGCQKDEIENSGEIEGISYPDGYVDWTETTHGNSSDPDYSIVFEQDNVLRFDIEISSNSWLAMQADLSANLGSSGGPGGGIADVDFDPVWAPCTFQFNNTDWYNVGIRFKGNSSLQSAYQSGNNKLSFKLDFDEFEDDYPDLKNQRFYGFKQLNLNNNYNDASLMREKVGADLFRDFGLVSAQTAFCIIYVDHGAGSQYFGVYTLIEEVDDTVLESQFLSESGNLYKPDGDAASFAQGSYDAGEMEKANNEDLADYSDVASLYDIINSSERTTNNEQWKSNLSAIFNVDGFMKWLAANTVMQNWDTYGIMTHNYYLYNNPDNSLLTWIPWDNNEALQYGKMGGALSLPLDDVGTDWPLIRYLMDVDDYEQKYKDYVLQFIEEVFIPENMITKYENYYELLKVDAYNEVSGYTYLNNDSDFDQAVTALKSHVQSRNSAALSYLE